MFGHKKILLKILKCNTYCVKNYWEPFFDSKEKVFVFERKKKNNNPIICIMCHFSRLFLCI